MSYVGKFIQLCQYSKEQGKVEKGVYWIRLIPSTIKIKITPEYRKKTAPKFPF
jgi:hypothetical protein